ESIIQNPAFLKISERQILIGYVQIVLPNQIGIQKFDASHIQQRGTHPYLVQRSVGIVALGAVHHVLIAGVVGPELVDDTNVCAEPAARPLLGYLARTDIFKRTLPHYVPQGTLKLVDLELSGLGTWYPRDAVGQVVG